MPQVQIEPVQSHSPNASVPAIFKTVPLWQAGVLTVVCLWLYWPTLRHLIGQWWHDPNFSHGFFVPLFSAFVIWQERERLSRVLPRPSRFGLVVLFLGLGVLIVGRLGAELFLERSSMLLVLAGARDPILGMESLPRNALPVGIPAHDDSDPNDPF